MTEMEYMTNFSDGIKEPINEIEDVYALFGSIINGGCLFAGAVEAGDLATIAEVADLWLTTLEGAQNVLKRAVTTIRISGGMAPVEYAWPNDCAWAVHEIAERLAAEREKNAKPEKEVDPLDHATKAGRIIEKWIRESVDAAGADKERAALLLMAADHVRDGLTILDNIKTAGDPVVDHEAEDDDPSDDEILDKLAAMIDEGGEHAEEIAAILGCD